MMESLLLAAGAGIWVSGYLYGRRGSSVESYNRGMADALEVVGEEER